MLVAMLPMCRQSPPATQSMDGKSVKEFRFEEIDDIHTDDIAYYQDYDEDGLFDFDEAFGFICDAKPPVYSCDAIKGVAVRLSPKQFLEFCEEAKSYKGDARKIDQWICKNPRDDIVEPLESGAAYIRIGELFKVRDAKGELIRIEPTPEVKKALKKLKSFPKDTRNLYFILDPFQKNHDSDGDNLSDILELGYQGGAKASLVDEEPLSKLLSLVESPGNRPNVAAFPIIRIIMNNVVVTPDLTQSTSDAGITTVEQNSSFASGGSMTVTAGFEIGASLFGPVSKTTYSLAYSQNWNKSTGQSDAYTVNKTYSESANISNYATFTPNVILVNLGSAPISQSTAQAPASIGGQPMGQISFKTYWDGTQATLPPMDARQFSPESPFHMTKEQYRKYFIGAPIEFDITMSEGNIFEKDDFGKIQAQVFLANASVIWEGTFQFAETGREYFLPYEQFGFAGGNRSSSSQPAYDNVQKPLVPVTLKDLLVTTLGYEEIWEDDPATGESYLRGVKFREGPNAEWRDSITGLKPGRVRIVTNFANGINGASARNPWMMITEGRNPYPAKNARDREDHEAFAKVIQQIVRPKDRFLLRLLDEEAPATIMKAVYSPRRNLNGSETKNLVSVVVDTSLITEVRLLIEREGEDPAVLEIEGDPQQSSGGRIYEIELDESIDPSDPEVALTAQVLINQEVVAAKAVTPIITKKSLPPPVLLKPFANSSSGGYAHHQAPGFGSATPVLQSFGFEYADQDSDRPVRGISVIPSAYSHVLRAPEDRRKNDFLTTALYDKNKDDTFKYNVRYAMIDKDHDLKVQTVNTDLKYCTYYQEVSCRLPVHVKPNEAFVLSGFELGLKDAIDFELMGMRVMPVQEEGRTFVDIKFYSRVEAPSTYGRGGRPSWNSGRQILAQIAYVAIPETLLHVKDNQIASFESSGAVVKEGFSSQVTDIRGIKVLQGFEFTYPKDNAHINALAFEFIDAGQNESSQSSLQVTMTDDTFEKDATFSLRYVILKSEL